MLIGAAIAFYYDCYCLLLRRRLRRLITKALADVCWWLTSFVAAGGFWMLIVSQGLRLSAFIYILVGVVIYRITIRQYILRWYIIHHRGKKPLNRQEPDHNRQNIVQKINNNNWETIFDRPALAVWRSKERTDLVSKSFAYRLRLIFLKMVIEPLEKRIKKS